MAVPPSAADAGQTKISDQGKTSERKKSPDPRTVFAAERTALAWIRTGLALMGFGFVVARFGLFLRKLSEIHGLHMRNATKGTNISMYIGVALVLIGVMVNITAAYRHGKLMRQLQTGEPPPNLNSPVATAVAVLLALIGVAIAVYLMIVSK